MALPVSFYSRTLADNTLGKNGSPETTTFRVPVVALTAANVVAQQALLATLGTATAGITLGVVNKTTTTLADTPGNPGPSSNPLAQREQKWFVRYHDAVNYKKFDVSIGTADTSLLTNNSEFLDLSDGGPIEAFVDAFEAVVKSPYDDTHAVVVDSIQYVGRNT